MSQTQAAVTQVPGFRAVGVICGLKKSGNPDLALLLSEHPCTAAAVFTQNKFKAAPLLYDMALLDRTRHLRGVVINAGNANAVTGDQGLEDARQMARHTEQSCDLPPDTIFVMSTGVIGELLPMARLVDGINQAAHLIQTEAGLRGDQTAQAIMTTDLVSKEAFVQVDIGGQLVSLGGMAKGSGMIHPNMATLLGVVTTDVAIEPAALNMALRRAVNASFNCITVDGDTSTNDTVLALASGLAKNQPLTVRSPDFEPFVAALTELCIQLAQAIARDGEGATKLITITVSGATSVAHAEQAARTVATSPLVKTALFGNDPNWGRVLAALGRSGVDLDPAQTKLRLGEFLLVEQGRPLPFDVEAAADWLATVTEVTLLADLGVGQASATVWTCDFSYKYVEINAEYHT